jgi:hypothetical protein
MTLAGDNIALAGPVQGGANVVYSKTISQRRRPCRWSRTGWTGPVQRQAYSLATPLSLDAHSMCHYLGMIVAHASNVRFRDNEDSAADHSPGQAAVAYCTAITG